MFFPVDDNIVEGDEEFTLQIVPMNSNDEAVAGGTSFTVLIEDNDSKFERSIHINIKNPCRVVGCSGLA